jgi:hypothetical protein
LPVFAEYLEALVRNCAQDVAIAEAPAVGVEHEPMVPTPLKLASARLTCGVHFGLCAASVMVGRHFLEGHDSAKCGILANCDAARNG